MRFAMDGHCPSGGRHHIVPRYDVELFEGVATRMCWNCKSIFMWVVMEDKRKRCQGEAKLGKRWSASLQKS